MNKAQRVPARFRVPRGPAAIHSHGFSYIEVVVAVFLIATVLVPASDLLSSALRGSEIHQEQSAAHHHLVAKMEYVLSRPQSELLQQADSAGSANVIIAAYSDSAGTFQRRLVYLARYDADNADADNNAFTGVEANLLWLKVQIEGSSTQAITLVGTGQ